MNKQVLQENLVFVLHDFFSEQTCQEHIARTEEMGYIDAPITTGSGFVMRKDIRNNDRVIHDDPVLAESLFELAKPFLPAEWFGRELVGLNERFRYYRYDPGQRFARHTDGFFQRDNGERSELTFMVYLNEGFKGGATKFHFSKPPLTVEPERGKALVFMHRVSHEGLPVEVGRKYVLRTDVMYRDARAR